MTKTSTPEFKFLYVIRCNGGFVGSPTDRLTTNPNLAATWTDEAEAAKVAKAIGGVVATRQIVDEVATAKKQKAAGTASLSLPPATSPAPARARRSKAEPKPSPSPQPDAAAKSAKAPKELKGISRTDADAVLAQTKLQFRDMSKPQWGDPKGPRIVLNAGDRVVRAWVYKMADATSLAGWLPEDKRPGAVTHETPITDVGQLHALVAAVCEANGLKAPKAPSSKPARKRRQASTTGEQEGATGDEADQAKDSPTPDSGTSGDTGEAL